MSRGYDSTPTVPGMQCREVALGVPAVLELLTEDRAEALPELDQATLAAPGAARLQPADPTTQLSDAGSPGPATAVVCSVGVGEVGEIRPYRRGSIGAQREYVVERRTRGAVPRYGRRVVLVLGRRREPLVIISSCGRSSASHGYHEVWDLLEQLWAETVAKERRLPPELLRESVDGEWSFIETLRHLVFATDAWVRRAVLGEPEPWVGWAHPFAARVPAVELGVDQRYDVPDGQVLDRAVERYIHEQRAADRRTAQVHVVERAARAMNSLTPPALQNSRGVRMARRS